MPAPVITNSPEETRALAAEVAARLARTALDRAAVVTLRGDLGAGKTAFAQGLLAALGVEDPVTSPTFVLVQRYPLEDGLFADAYHVDAYRLASADDLAAIGMEEVLADPMNLVVVEWPEVGGDLFDPAVDVALSHGATSDQRSVAVDWRA